MEKRLFFCEKSKKMTVFQTIWLHRKFWKIRGNVHFHNIKSTSLFQKSTVFFGKSKKRLHFRPFHEIGNSKKIQNFWIFSKKCYFYDIKSTWLLHKNVLFFQKTEKMTSFQTISEESKFVKIGKILTFLEKNSIFSI